jgi:hypothetical protein
MHIGLETGARWFFFVTLSVYGGYDCLSCLKVPHDDRTELYGMFLSKYPVHVTHFWLLITSFECHVVH